MNRGPTTATTASLWAIAVALVLAVACALWLHRTERAEHNNGPSKAQARPPVALCERSSRIFVSIASYRDRLCKATVESMYANARFPERVYAGVYEQNKADDDDESCLAGAGSVAARYAGNVRTVTVDASAASGPCTARYQCSMLMRDEEAFLQIDSHSEFAQGWDVHAIHMLRSLPGAQDGSVVISTYTVDCGDGWEGSDPPVIDKAKYAGGWITFEATIRAEARSRAIPSRQIGGGFLLCVADVIRNVPLDPGLAGLFNNEELLYSARLHSCGVSIVAPRRNLVCHRYTNNPDHRTVWTDNAAWDADKGGPSRADALLMGTHADQFGTYGMGTKRPLADFWRHVGIDYKTKTVGAWPS
jgi:hypothetical protein